MTNAKADETLKRADIHGEHGLAVEEGLATSRAQSFDDTAGDIVPGAGMLVNRARRIVVVTDQHVHLLQGRRYDRPRERVGTYDVGPHVMTFDGEKLTFPDGQVVYLSRFQAETLVHAAGGDLYAGLADLVIQRAGISGGRGITVERGTVPKNRKHTVGSQVLDVTLGGSDLDLRQLSEHRMVLVTDAHVYVLEARSLYEPGPVLASYPVGPGVLSMGPGDESFVHRLTFQDGQFVDILRSEDARRIATAATRAS